MTRPLVRFAGLAALAVGLAACAASPAETWGEEAAQNGAETLTVFAAASLQEAFDELLEQYARGHPEVTINPAVYDGSSTLVTQLQEGAQADVLATANESTMNDAVAAELLTSDLRLFASNDLVIAVPEDNPHEISDVVDVLDLNYATCAVQVPCGYATAQLFEAAGLTPAPISEEQSVTAVANRVAAGEVDAGFIYSTDAAARPELTGISPQTAQIVNYYPIATTADSEAGAAFVEFVLSDRGGDVLAAHGFGQP